jgi:hypothetical protein
LRVDTVWLGAKRTGIKRIYRFGLRVVTGRPEGEVGLAAREAVGKRMMRGVEAVERTRGLTVYGEIRGWS